MFFPLPTNLTTEISEKYTYSNLVLSVAILLLIGTGPLSKITLDIIGCISFRTVLKRSARCTCIMLSINHCLCLTDVHVHMKTTGL